MPSNIFHLKSSEQFGVQCWSMVAYDLKFIELYGFGIKLIVDE